MTIFYRYPLAIRLAKAWGWLLAGVFVISLVIVLFSVPRLLTVDPVKGLVAFFSTGGGVIASIYFVHIYCDVGITENELLVKFFWFYLHVPGNEILDIRPIPMPFSKAWIIKTTRLTVFHRLYGLLSNGSTYPSFIVSSKIVGCDELIRKINKLKATH
jgi:hypothetical protein